MNPYDPPPRPQAELPSPPRAPSPLLVALLFGVSGTLLSYPFIGALLVFEICAPELPEPRLIDRVVWTMNAALSSTLGPLLAFRLLADSASSRFGRFWLSLIGTWLAVVGIFALGAAAADLLDIGTGMARMGLADLLRMGPAFVALTMVFGLTGVVPWIILEITLARSSRTLRRAA